ncbi:MAG: hypothetical protein ACLFUB_13570 [Cyclobacteriaceae bacterium]
MNYQEILTENPKSAQSYPRHSVEFFDDAEMKSRFYLNIDNLKGGAEDKIESIVDSYLDDHPDIQKAVAYREESPDSRFAFREFGRN